MDKTFLEFFAGIGLVRLGLAQRGWRAVWANDIDAKKRLMHQTHFGADETHYHLGDVHEVSAAALPEALLATASFPCTDLSLAGARKGLHGQQSGAFFGFIRVLEQLGERRPPVVMIENVTGFLTSHHGKDFQQAMLALNELGYAVDPLLLDAKWFTPQSRPRLFVVGSRLHDQSDDAAWRLFAPTRLRPTPIVEFVTSHPQIRWSLRDLPEPPMESRDRLADILEDLPDDAPQWWSEKRATYLYDQMSKRHRATADQWIEQAAWSYGTVFRRVRRQDDGAKRSMAELRCDGLAGCLRTPKGGSARQILFKAGFGRYAVRLLTAMECARLMGADEFRIEASLNQALFGFGDAVCATAVAWIAQYYLNPLIESASAPAASTGASV